MLHVTCLLAEYVDMMIHTVYCSRHLSFPIPLSPLPTPQVATRAESWAKYLGTNATVYGKNPCSLVRSEPATPIKAGGMGQNLTMLVGGGDTRVPWEGVSLWVNEGGNYDDAMVNPYHPSAEVAASGCRTGRWSDCWHWTQVRREHNITAIDC